MTTKITLTGGADVWTAPTPGDYEVHGAGGNDTITVYGTSIV